MSDSTHRLYITILVFIVAGVLVYLSYTGYSYYNTALEERFYHPDHKSLKPSGPVGHGLGIIGSLCLIIGVFGYMARKRKRYLAQFGQLKYWLEFHIFLATLGPVMILFHTAFKFGGIVAISFWSMVAVFLSGIIGRFIYLQIPRTIEGRELSLGEIRNMKSDVGAFLKENYNLDEESHQFIVDSTRKKVTVEKSNPPFEYFKKYFEDKRTLGRMKKILKKNNLSKKESSNVMKMAKNELTLNRRIDRLRTMQELFKYWHVVHLPFALVMLIIMIIHVIVTIVFGYTWIF